MKRLFEALTELAPTNANLLVEGETGVGKELVAEEVHRRSSRSTAAMVAFDCAALSPAFAARELLGPNDAAPDAESSLGRARGGTLVLDHVEGLARELQVRLHEALASTDVRVIALTTTTLSLDIHRGDFHSALYRHIATPHLLVPPLRERLEDLPLLVEALLLDHGLGVRPEDLPPQLWEHFQRQCWRGNVRELNNMLSRWLVMRRAAVRN
jgi:DNA-binding NtrC family response regulator